MRPAALALLLSGAALAGCGDGRPDDKTRGLAAPPVAELVPAPAALQGADVPTLDPHTMDDAELRRVIGAGPRCEFRYTSSGKPVLAFAPAGAGVVKLNGKLVALRTSPSAGDGPPVLQAGDVTLRIRPDRPVRVGDARGTPADMTFDVRAGEGLTVGYRGYYGCPRAPDRTPGAAEG